MKNKKHYNLKDEFKKFLEMFKDVEESEENFEIPKDDTGKIEKESEQRSEAAVKYIEEISDFKSNVKDNNKDRVTKRGRGRRESDKKSRDTKVKERDEK